MIPIDRSHVAVSFRTGKPHLRIVAPALLALCAAILLGIHDAVATGAIRHTIGLATSIVHPQYDMRLMLSAKEWAQDQQGPTMDQMFPPNGFAMRFPILVWLALLELLGLVGFPFAFLVFANLSDRGFVVAKTLGLLLLGYGAWITLSLHLATYDAGLLFLVLLLLALASCVLAFRLRSDIYAFLRRNWRPVLAGEAVFLAGFALFVLLRMWYPDLGHQFAPVSAANAGDGRMGEKQMELAYLNAIVRSRVFPPYDPFFAHGYINYYYYGFYLVGTLCKLAQIAPATGFNLAIATFFAMLVGNIYSAVSTLTRRIFPGVIAAVFVGVIGNLNGAWQLLRGLMSVAQVRSDVPLAGGIVDALSGLQQVIFARQPLPAFDYWEPTRIIPPAGASIAEFPYFTYLFADLHPHLMAYPITAAVLALAVSAALGSTVRVRLEVAGILVGGLLTGALVVTNPWDYPTYIAVLGLGAAVGAFAVRRRFSWPVLARPLVWLVGVAAVSAVLYFPFEHSYRTVFATGLGLVRDVKTQLEGSSGAQLGDIHDILTTPLRIYLEHFGFLLFVVGSYLAVLLLIRGGGAGWMRRTWIWLQFVAYYRDRVSRVRHAGRVARRMMGRQHAPVERDLAIGVFIVVCGLLVVQDYLLAFLVGLGGLAILLLSHLRRTLPAGQLFVLALLLIPIGLSVVTQLVFIKDWLAGGSAFRMNTVFKFYNQAWVLYASCAAAGLYYFVSELVAGRPSESSSRTTHDPLGPSSLSGEAPALQARTVAAGQSAGFLQLLGPGLARFSSVGTGEVAAGPVPAPAPAALSHLPVAARAPRLVDAAGRIPGAWMVCFVLLLAASLVYTYAGTVARETYRATWLPESSVPFTLDGMAFMKVAYPGDYAGINWLNANVHGAKVIAEADDAYYNWRSRVSMFTGLPDIYNGIHEAEQRYGDELDPTGLCGASTNPAACLNDTHPRQDDVKTLYDSTSSAAALRVIQTYGVRYIYVGFSERQLYSKAGLAKFHRMTALKVVFRHPGVVIYAVKR